MRRLLSAVPLLFGCLGVPASLAAQRPAAPSQVLPDTEKPKDLLSAFTKREGERWAVVIGISQYADPKIRGLQYANKDAISFYNFLISPSAGLGGLKRDHIKLLVDSAASFQGIRSALRDFLKKSTSDDVVYIYFAGHGGPDPDRLDDLYLLAYDTKADAIASTGVPMKDISEATQRIRAHSLVVFVDACHSAGVGDMIGTRASGEENRINVKFLSQLESAAHSKVIVTASEELQLSREGPQWGGGHGVFTHYLLEGLRGAADGQDVEDSLVTLGEAFEYTRRKVSRETSNAQVPTISQTQYDRNWPMAIVLPGANVTAQGAPAGAAPTGSSASRSLSQGNSAAADASAAEASFLRGNIAGAISPATAACSGGSGSACSLLGDVYWHGLSVRRDVNRGLDFYQTACDARDGRGCSRLAGLYYAGNGVPLDSVRAGEFNRRACENGYSSACFDLAGAYLGGLGVLQDSVRAASLYALAAEVARQRCGPASPRDCGVLGDLFKAGRSVERNPQKATESFAAGCDAGDGRACRGLAQLQGSGSLIDTSTAAMVLFQRACDKNDEIGCIAFAYSADARRTSTDSTRATAYFERACGLGEPRGCNYLGIRYHHAQGVTRSDARAVELYKLACDFGFTPGCANLGVMYDRGDGVTQDAAKASALYRTACTRGDTSGCIQLGVLYRDGRGVPKDVNQTLALWDQACTKKYLGACLSLSQLYDAGAPGLAVDKQKAATYHAIACSAVRKPPGCSE